MDRRDLLIVFSAGLLAFAAGYLVGQSYFGLEMPEGYTSEFDFTVNESQDTRTFEFDNRSVGLLFADGGEMRAFVDINNDGSAERLLNTTSDSEEHTTTEVITKDGRSYRLYFRYRDGPQEDDGYAKVYRVSEIV